VHIHSLGASSHSPEDVHTMPEYAQNVLPELNERELPVLVLASHGHSPPLNPTPDLRIDVRSLPNPPKHIRDAYNGTSKRLQEWMKEDPVFITRRDAIRTEIEAAITKKKDEQEKKEVLKVESEDKRNDSQVQSSLTGPGTGVDDLGNPSDHEDDNEDVNASSGNEEENERTADRMNFRVGIFCAMGRHRSVAMVEELAKMSWAGWQVKVEHRDISKKRGQGKKSGSRAKKSRGTRGGASSYVDDDYE
jgi:hypothetical protein